MYNESGIPINKNEGIELLMMKKAPAFLLSLLLCLALLALPLHAGADGACAAVRTMLTVTV